MRRRVHPPPRLASEELTAVPRLSRRSVLASAASAASAAAALPFARSASAAPAAVPATLPVRTPLTGHGPVAVRWLEGGTPAELAGGTTFGVPWPRGAFAPDQRFALTADTGTAVPVQTWVTGWWPDGSVKWTAHAASGADPRAAGYTLSAGAPAAPAIAVTVAQ